MDAEASCKVFYTSYDLTPILPSILPSDWLEELFAKHYGLAGGHVILPPSLIITDFTGSG